MTAPAETRGRFRLGAALRAAGRAEAQSWLSIGRWLFRRPRVPAGASAFAYHAPILTVLVVFVVLSGFELVVVDFLLHAWPWVRFPVLILGIWGFFWMLGLLFGYLTRPHAVGPDGIRARQGAGIDIDLPWDVVSAVSPARDVAEKAPPVRDEAHGRTLALRMQNETNVLIELEQPVPVVLGATSHVIDAVRIWVDDLPGFLAAVRTHIP